MATLLGCLVIGMGSQALAATQRYASPTGGGTACTQSAPCGIVNAVNGSAAGDEVIINPGDYNAIATTVGPFFNNTYVHGVQGQPPPRLHFTTGYLRIGNPGDRASYLQLDGSTTTPLQVDNTNTQGDQIYSHSTGNDACIVYGTLIDSVCWASGPGGSAISGAASIDYTPVFRNVTAEASGTGSDGIEYHSSSGGNIIITAVNVIIHGGASDISIQATLPDTMTVNIDHSNFVTGTPTGSGAAINTTATQGAAPHFVNAGTGDFREAAGSPTIDAGVTAAANGPFDFLGKPRVINGLTDIGADEFDPFTGVAMRDGKSKVKKRKVGVSMGCPAGTPTSCAGTLTLTFGKKTAGASAFSIPSGTTQTVKVKVSKKALKKLNAKGKLATHATAAVTDGAGISATTSAKVKLKP